MTIFGGRRRSGSSSSRKMACSSSFPMKLFATVLFFVLCFSTTVCASRNVYIVYMGERHHEDPQVVLEMHHGVLSQVIGSKEEAISSILYSYRHGFSGFAARLTESQAKLVSGFPSVACVVRNRILNVHTTRSWDFLQLSHTPESRLLSQSNSGDGVIIGFLDTGIWPESESFRDEGMGKIPVHWKGICQTGENFTRFSCSRIFFTGN